MNRLDKENSDAKGTNGLCMLNKMDRDLEYMYLICANICRVPANYSSFIDSLPQTSFFSFTFAGFFNENI